MTVTAILLAALLFVAGPIATIAAINHLFNTGIGFTFPSWLAIFWLQMVLVTKK